MMTAPVATIRIQRELKQVESGVDHLFAQHAALMASLATARADLNADFAQSHAPLLRLRKAQDALFTFRAEIGRVHAEVERIARERGDIMLEPKPSNGSLDAGNGLVDEIAVA